MPNCIVFENDFKVRETLCSELEGRGNSCFPCYSDSKLKHLLESKAKDPSGWILVINEKEKTKIDLTLVAQLTTLDYSEKDVSESQKRLDLINQVEKVSRRSVANQKQTYDIFCVGSSTGGLPVIQQVFEGYRTSETITVICQHINKDMTGEMTQTIDRKIRSNVEFVHDTTELKKGCSYVLAGGSDYILKMRYGKLCLVKENDAASIYHPSFDYLMQSISCLDDYKVACLILSGLGNDGSKNIHTLRKQGVDVFVQDPKDSVAPYMPESAIKTGQVTKVLSIDEIKKLLKRSAV